MTAPQPDAPTLQERLRSIDTSPSPFIHSPDPIFVEAADALDARDAVIANLVDATTYARNRLEILASDAWNIDGRDLKRNLQGVFAEYAAALAKAALK